MANKKSRQANKDLIKAFWATVCTISEEQEQAITDKQKGKKLATLKA